MKTKSIIESCYPTLTKAERRIADFILNDRDNEILDMTLCELSGRIGLGEATIVRFCRKIDLGGFQNFKFTLALDASYQEQTAMSDSYLDAIEQNIISTIQKTRNLMNPEMLENAVRMITHARQLYLYGAGSSAFVAEMAEERLIRVGRTCKSIKESHLQCNQSAICGPEDVILVISISGSTIDLYDAVRIAKENKCGLITITNHIHSPMAMLSDCVLLSCGKENPVDGGTLISVTSQLYVADALCTKYFLENTDTAIAAKEKVGRAINRKLNRL